MSVVIFSNERTTADLQVERIACGIDSSIPVEWCRSVGDLGKRLQGSRRLVDAAVLVTEDLSELRELVLLGDSLIDVRLIVAVPRLDGETVCLAHQLRPRYLTLSGGGLRDVAVVLMRMLRRGNSPQESHECSRHANKVSSLCGGTQIKTGGGMD